MFPNVHNAALLYNTMKAMRLNNDCYKICLVVFCRDEVC